MVNIDFVMAAPCSVWWIVLKMGLEKCIIKARDEC
jgi:hypothetical protein